QASNASKVLTSDGANTSWQPGGGGGGSGTVTHTTGALTAGQIIIGNNAGDVKIDTGCLTDGIGNQTCTSYNGSGSGETLLTMTSGATPATPVAGQITVYGDSTGKRLHDINDAGLVGTTVVPLTCAGGNFFNKLDTTGSLTCATGGGGGGN